MFDNRHCLDKDLDLLIKETNRFKSFLSSGSFNEELKQYLSLIKRFDIEISDKLEREITKAGTDIKMIESIIDRNINELIHYVKVDIYEHSGK